MYENRRVWLERCKLTLSYEIVSENYTFLKVSNHFNEKKYFENLMCLVTDVEKKFSVLYGI